MDTTAIEQLHKQLLTYWNKQNAKGMASLFASDGNIIGFDGSQMDGPFQIESELAAIFGNHKTARYVWRVKEVRFLNSYIALLKASAGMVPPGKHEINAATNAVQSLVAIKQNEAWKISLFQNTPAQFHGRPELVEEMIKELSGLI